MSLSKEYTPEEMEELESKATQFHNALFNSQGITDEGLEDIANIICTTTNEERQIIRANYKKANNHPIQDDIKSQLVENFPLLMDLCLDMFDTPYEFDARELNKVLSVIGAEEDIIIEIFVTRPKNHLEIVDVAYKKFFGISLKEEIQNQFQKQFAQFLLSIMESERPFEQTISGDEAYAFAKEIAQNGYKAYCNDVNLFKKTFLEKSREDLILISRAYYELEQKDLYDIFEEENIIQKSLFDEQEEEKKVRNKNAKLIKGILFGVIAPAQFYAKKCISCLTGFTTDIKTLFRVLVNRVEIDMDAIRDYYLKETNCEIAKDIENEATCKENNEIGSILSYLSSK